MRVVGPCHTTRSALRPGVAAGQDRPLHIRMAGHGPTVGLSPGGERSEDHRSSLRQLGEAVDVLAALPGRIEFVADITGTTRINESPRTTPGSPVSASARCLRAAPSTGMDDTKAAEWIAAQTTGGKGEFAQFAVSGAREGDAFAHEATRVPARFDKLKRPQMAVRPAHRRARRTGHRRMTARSLVLVELGARLGWLRHRSLAATELSGTGTVGGLMLDRLVADGALTGWNPSFSPGPSAVSGVAVSRSAPCGSHRR